jgi:hypothetical protein
MTEYFRSVDGAGKLYQFVDTRMAMILKVTDGEPLRINGSSIIPYEEALVRYLSMNPALAWGYVLVPLAGIRPYPVSTSI